MSNKSDLAKLELVLEYISDIYKIVKRHDNIENALLDFEGQYAVLMCLQQIGETINKIESEKYKLKIPVKNIVGFRNIITHNYDGVNLCITEQIISENLPKLEKIVKKLID